MKKLAIAAAVSAAFASVPAIAQVTVSGMIETGYVSRDADVVKAQTIGRGFAGTPHFKLTGSEDLGGGLRASMHLQYDLNASANSSGLVGYADQTSFAVASVSLSGGFGSVQVGQFTVAPRDAGGVYRFMGDIGRLASPTNSAITDGSLVGFNTGAYIDAVQYSTPVMSGFQVNAYTSAAGKVAAANREANQQGYNITGAMGQLRFSAGSEQVQTSASSGGKRKLDTVGAAYDLGIAKIGLVNATNKTEGTSPTKSDAMGIHAATTQGALTFGVSMTRYKTSGTTAKNDVTTLGVKYDLSKRTNVQATYQTVKSGTTSIAKFATRGLEVAGRDNATTNGYGVQVQHSF